MTAQGLKQIPCIIMADKLYWLSYLSNYILGEKCEGLLCTEEKGQKVFTYNGKNLNREPHGCVTRFSLIKAAIYS